MPQTNQNKDMSDVCLRLDFIWDRELDGNIMAAEHAIAAGKMGHAIETVSGALTDGKTHVCVVAETDALEESEITVYRDQVKYALETQVTNQETELDEVSEIHITTVIFNESKVGANTPVRAGNQIPHGAPILHIAVNMSGVPVRLSTTELEKIARNRLGDKGGRVDVHNTGNGFNFYFRDETIRRSDAQMLKQAIIDEEEASIPDNVVKTIYTTPNSDEISNPTHVVGRND